jgi:hypothetical protein
VAFQSGTCFLSTALFQPTRFRHLGHSRFMVKDVQKDLQISFTFELSA